MLYKNRTSLLLRTEWLQKWSQLEYTKILLRITSTEKWKIDSLDRFNDYADNIPALDWRNHSQFRTICDLIEEVCVPSVVLLCSSTFHHYFTSYYHALYTVFHNHFRTWWYGKQPDLTSQLELGSCMSSYVRRTCSRSVMALLDARTQCNDQTKWSNLTVWWDQSWLHRKTKRNSLMEKKAS